MLLELLLSILLVGAVAGLIGGVTGAGIGAVTVPSLIMLGFDPIPAIGASLALQVVVASLGSVAHHRLGNVQARIFGPLVLAGALGAFLGANITTHLPVEELKVVLGVVVTVIGIILLTKPLGRLEGRRTTRRAKLLGVSLPFIALIGFIAGAVTGALGAAWGSLGVSALILAGAVPHAAAGSALLARIPVAFVGVWTYITVGSEFQLDLALPLLAAGSVFVLIGAVVSSRLHPQQLKEIIGAAVMFLGVLLLIKVALGAGG